MLSSTSGSDARTAAMTSRTLLGVPIPVVSPYEIDEIPASTIQRVTSTTRSGGTSPSYGHPNAVDIVPSTGMPPPRATSTTAATSDIDSLTDLRTLRRVYEPLSPL